MNDDRLSDIERRTTEPPSAVIPRATYRIQFSPQFTFHDAEAIIPYLRDLGISHLYASPILQARPDSAHGYDTTDYGSLNSQLGSDAEFDALVAALRSHDMGLIVDMVPNHMGIMTDANRWWTDVLENGPSSVWAPVFDITWQPVKHELANKVLLPVFEDQYGAVLESGKLRLKYEHGAFFIDSGDMILPVTPDTYGRIIADAVAGLSDHDDTATNELRSIVTALSYLPSYSDQTPEIVAVRNREKEIAKRRLAALTGADDAIRSAIERTLNDYNGTVGDPRSFDKLDALLNAQPYRLASFRVAGDEINYRRFFNINDMAAIKIEREDVFEAVHRRIVQMMKAGQIDGLRIDHPDGLWDPATYFRRLQGAFAAARLGDGADVDLMPVIAGSEPSGEYSDPPLYVVAEKILSESEPLPRDWLVHGTTGYDFLNLANGLFVDMRSADRLTSLYEQFTGRSDKYEDVVYRSKLATMDESLASEINALGHELNGITETSRAFRDFTRNGLTRALREVIASLSIYRTYVTANAPVSERDRNYVLEAVLDARRRNPGTLRSLLTFVRDTLLLHNLDSFAPEDRERVVTFAMRFQQMTGPIMAKSVEDTAFYVYNRLISLNEVGGHPDRYGVTVAEFHEQTAQRAAEWPHAMLASSTHDTKRSEDVRARINALSELSDDWETAVFRWSAMNAPKKTIVDGAPAPDANDEYLYYQTLIGAWDETDETLRERLHAYVQKALNEAKVHTSWINPDDEYMAAVHAFLDRTLDDPGFLDDFRTLERRVALIGRINGLAQTLLKLTAPGVPDIYQGTELWSLSLVDPDNRRPVDFALRRRLLAELNMTGGEGVHAPQIDSLHDGRVKLYTIAATLRFRARHAALFRCGRYVPLTAEGERAENVCAFARELGGNAVIAAVPRLVSGMIREDRLDATVWGETVLSVPHCGTYRNIFTGHKIAAANGKLRLADLFSSFPVALLAMTPAGGTELC